MASERAGRRFGVSTLLRADAEANELATRVAREFGTPSAVVDLDVAERNIARQQVICEKAGIANRPHIKTHKSPELAKTQMAAGASGITCQKLGEAEVMADAGLDDILISYNLIGEQKMARLARLAERIEVRVVADNPTVVDGLVDAAAKMTRPLKVLVECDTGRRRAGVVKPEEAIALAGRIDASEGLSFDGLLLYPTGEGWQATREFVEHVTRELGADGLACATISTGGTPNLSHLGELPGATEHRAGTFIFNDRMMLRNGVAELDDVALHVVATVVSRAEDDRGILDAGSKTLTSDTGGGLDGHGLIREYPEARIASFAEEHGFLDLSHSARRPAVGEVVRIVPNHVCVVVNMMDQLIAVRGQEIVGPLQVAARGKLI